MAAWRAARRGRVRLRPRGRARGRARRRRSAATTSWAGRHGAVAGHPNRLKLASVPAGGGRELRLALACGRPHRYEGWSDEELEAPVRALAAAGVSRLVLTNSCGALRRGGRGRAVVVLGGRRPAAPAGRRRAGDAAAVRRDGGGARWPRRSARARRRRRRYVAVRGPQFETPAEVAWLAGYGDVVGMSAAPEARAAAATGVECVSWRSWPTSRPRWARTTTCWPPAAVSPGCSPPASRGPRSRAGRTCTARSERE